MSVTVPTDSVDPQGRDPNVPDGEALPAPKSAPACKGGPCLDNKRALTDYADALDKLWQP